MESVHVDATSAKDIAIYFAKATDTKITSTYMPRAINIAKTMLGNGWTQQEIEFSIDELIRQGKSMYSLGYVKACIADVVKEMNKESNKALAKQLQEDAEKGVKIEDVKTTSNKGKLNRLNGKSNIGKKRNFDLPWES